MKYQVIVGNIGTVYDGDDPVAAMNNFETYKHRSDENLGRAAGETVTLMEDGEIKVEHIGWMQLSS